MSGSEWKDPNADDQLAYAQAARRRAEDEVVQLARERDEYHQLFTLQQSRMGEAVELWRQEDLQQRAGVLPDLGELLQWLLARGRQGALYVNGWRDGCEAAARVIDPDATPTPWGGPDHVDACRDAATRIRDLASRGPAASP